MFDVHHIVNTLWKAYIGGVLVSGLLCAVSYRVDFIAVRLWPLMILSYAPCIGVMCYAVYLLFTWR